MSEEFIREVDEELKEEKQAKLWKKIAPYLISIAGGIVLFTTFTVGWQSFITKKTQAMGDDFSAAVQLISEQDKDAAILALDKVTESTSDGYITLAKLKKASLLIEDGRVNEGLKIYLELEKTAVDSSFRDMSTIFYVLNAMDTLPSMNLIQKIDKLTNPNNPWSSTATELKAFLYLKAEKKNESKKIFQILSEQPNIPSDLKNRAQDMLNFLSKKN
tara:strand:- start:863 stop:1513 length:651 start_codon:yes stop_codon:yes gene_type:complete